MTKFVDLIDVKKSPLTRIMSVYDDKVKERRKFENNICATHIGNGLIISVAHNLFNAPAVIKSFPEEYFTDKILTKVNTSDKAFLESKYIADSGSRKRYLNINNAEINKMNQILKNTQIDMRYLNLYNEKICNPFLIYNFNEQCFFDTSTDKIFNETNTLHEVKINKYSYLVGLELLYVDFKYDFTIYKIIDNYKELIPIIPMIDIDFTIKDNTINDLYCLQGAPADNLGRMINRAVIEGYIDQFSPIGNYRDEIKYFEGFRYLIKGYFRFGSSGAPYIFYNNENDRFYVNAIQSEACPQQLLIGNNRNGHAQYINAIATPLINIKDKILEFMEKCT